MSEENLPDIIYYNADLTNNQSNTYIPATYNVTRSDIILDDPALYYCSIIRFEVDGRSIPLSIFPTNSTDGSPDNTYYQIALANTTIGNENVESSFVIYTPSNVKIPNLNNPVWSIQHFLDDVNHAINVAYLLLDITGTTGYNVNESPYFYYDVSLARVDLITPLAWCNGEITLSLNINLYEEFGTFNTLFNRASSVVGAVPFDNYRLVVQNYGHNQAKFAYDIFDPASALIDSLITSSEYSNLYNMGVLRKILLISGSIPAVSEFTSNTSIVPSLTSMNSSDKILSDFIVPQDVPGAYRSMIQYVPTVYRLLDLKSNSKLVTIDLSFYWEDNFLSRRLMYLGPGSTMSVKLMFRKKTYNGVKLYNEIKKKDEKDEKEALAKKGIKQFAPDLPKQEVKLISDENLNKVKSQQFINKTINNSKKQIGGELLSIKNEEKYRQNMYSRENKLPINKKASSNKKLPYELSGGTSFPMINNNSSSNKQIPRF